MSYTNFFDCHVEDCVSRLDITLYIFCQTMTTHLYRINIIILPRHFLWETTRAFLGQQLTLSLRAEQILFWLLVCET